MAKSCKNAGAEITRADAETYMKAYQEFLDRVAQGNVFGAINLEKQPKYLKMSRILLEKMLSDPDCGGIGIALALTPDEDSTTTDSTSQFTLVVGPLKGDPDNCKLIIEDLRVVEDLGQGSTI